MCGILGQVIFNNSKKFLDLNWIEDSIIELKHRGPHFKNILFDQNKKYALGHTRLPIIDLTENNNQPFKLDNIILTYNGEIYNYLTLKKELISKGYKFLTSGDTEVLLTAYKEWGDNFLKKIEGMFAFALIDIKRELLIIARDKCGEKPLYYFLDNEFISFSSQLGQLIKFGKNIDKTYISEFFFKGFVSKQNTILNNVKKLNPGTAFFFNLKNGKFSEKKFFVKENFIKNLNTNSDKITQMEEILFSSVKKCLGADVNTGILLSGGIDSSLIAALANKVNTKINTFSVKFDEQNFDESKHSRIIAKHFNTNHNELIIKNTKFEDFLEILLKFDEPLIDSSLIPTFKIFENVKKQFRVTLGGDGADELFGGYNHYKYLKFIHFIKSKPILKNIKINIKLLKKINLINNDLYDNYFNKSEKIYYGIPNYFNFNDQKKLFNQNFFQFLKKNKEFHIFEKDYNDRIKLYDFENYLTQDILHKIDRCSMLNSVEARSPFLDETVISYAQNILNDNDKNSFFYTKIILKKLAKKILPKNFNYNRKKMGFSFPFARYLEDKNWKHDVKSIILDQNNIFNEKNINLLFKNIKYGNNAEKIFGILFYKLWSKKFNLH